MEQAKGDDKQLDCVSRRTYIVEMWKDMEYPMENYKQAETSKNV